MTRRAKKRRRAHAHLTKWLHHLRELAKKRPKGWRKRRARARKHVHFWQRTWQRLRPMRLNRTVAFDGTPVFRGLALMLADAREHGWTGTLTSADRRKGVAERYGKRSQWWLYMAYWVWHLAGTNPANRPGQSTHELRSDGVAYRGPVGRPLAWWQLGMDLTESDHALEVLQRRGYKAFRPYTSGSEAHHLNLRRSPARRLRKRAKA